MGAGTGRNLHLMAQSDLKLTSCFSVGWAHWALRVSSGYGQPQEVSVNSLADGNQTSG